MGWREKTKRVGVIGNEAWSLPDAINQAHQVWQRSHQLLDMAEQEETDAAVYYLLLTEKRYMYLLHRKRTRKVAQGL